MSSPLHGIHRALPLLTTFLLTSCSAIPHPPRTSILLANQQGDPLDPAPGFKPLDLSKFDAYLDDMFTDMASYCAEQRAIERGPCKVLIYVHGGLNSHHDSIQRSVTLNGKIRAAGYYPIFVVWDSSLFSSWLDHVAYVHHGLWSPRYKFLAPYVAATDELEGALKAPASWLSEIRHTIPPVGERSKLEEVAKQSYRDLITSPYFEVNDIWDPGRKDLADNRALWSEKVLPYVRSPLTAVSKIVTTPLVIQAAGGGAWDTMQRRATMLFRTEEQFTSLSAQNIATLAHFITRYQQDFLPQFCAVGTYTPPRDRAAFAAPRELEMKFVSCDDNLRLTIVSHSMGAIVVDQLLRFAPRIRVSNLVFMAAATSVDDYSDTVHHYLLDQRELHPKQDPTQVYHLVLHPTAEVFKEEFLGLPPRGSLLVWIDNFFSNPVSPLGRTVGRFINLFPEIAALNHETAERLRGQVHLKVFRYGKSCRCWSPQGHGDFGAFPFWQHEFWDPKEPTGDSASYVRWDDPSCKNAGQQPLCHDEH
jgi:hypothetical protein